MGTLTKILITVFFVAILFWVGFSNRGAVDFVWSPLSEPLTLPVAAVVLVATIAGFFWGGLIVWINEGPARRERRLQKKDIARLEKELNQARQQPTPVPRP